MRYRRISYRYVEVVGGLPRALEAEFRSTLRAQPMASPLHRPPADVVETPDAHIVTLELPGVAEDEMDVFLHPDALVVSGRRRCEEIPDAVFHTAEIRYGPFRFDMALPHDADAEHVEARMQRGLVIISIRKRVGGNS